MPYKKITVPANGEAITIKDNVLNVPNKPIIGYIEGDGIGADISPVMLNVVDAVVKKAYKGEREIQWMEIYAGEKADRLYGEYLPEETLEAIKEFSVAIKGPLTTPVGGGMRSLNVAIRQQLDLYICQRPVQYFDGTPSPVRAPNPGAMKSIVSAMSQFLADSCSPVKLSNLLNSCVICISKFEQLILTYGILETAAG